MYTLRTVALRKESVDRNNQLFCALFFIYTWSLSARRAWIEIMVRASHKPNTSVALRKESVDRNRDWSGGLCSRARSLSARRAWIEIKIPRAITDTGLVALRKESVDRNVYVR